MPHTCFPQEEALADALTTGTIAGAGIDVYEKEPVIHPKLLAEDIADKLFLLPHLSSAADQTRFNMTQRCLENARAVVWKGGAPINPLNAPTQAMAKLPVAEQARVAKYIELEFAFERAEEAVLPEPARL